MASEWGRWHELITCPWCGWTDQDSWEWNGYDGHERNCGECEKPFTLSVDFEVSYATEKVEKKQKDDDLVYNQKCEG